MSNRHIFSSFRNLQHDEENGQLPALSIRTTQPLISMPNANLDELEEKHQEEEDEHEDDPYMQLETIRKSAKIEQLAERRLKRRRKAHGTLLSRYFNVRLQLRVLFSSWQNIFILIIGELSIIGLFSFLVFGQVDSPTFWPDIETKWGGLLIKNSSQTCEIPKMLSFTRQRGNGFATCCYAIVGFFILFIYILDEQKRLTFEARFGNLPASVVLRRCSWSALIGLSLIYLAIGTWLRHATYSNTGKQLETTGYWAVLFAFCTCTVNRLVDPPRKVRTREYSTISKMISFLFIFVTVGVDIAFGIRLNTFGSEIPQIVFGCLAGFALLSCLIHWRMHQVTIETEPWLLIFGLFFFVIGFSLAHFDGDLCINENSFLQPYAVWHVCCAFSTLLFYLYLRSDLWVKGDGAELAPSIRPFTWIFLFCRFSIHWCSDVCKFSHLHEKEDQQHVEEETASGKKSSVEKRKMFPRPESKKDKPTPQVIENDEEKQDEQVARPQSNGNRSIRRLNTVRTLWTPQFGFSTKQLRIAEVFCGLIITGFIVYVIYLALGSPK